MTANMATPADLLATLGERDIRLWVEEGRLRYNAPRGAMTAELKRHLKERKTELLGLLNDAPPPLVRRRDHGEAPLSFAQTRLWFLDRLMPGETAYHLHTALEGTGRLRLEALERSFREIVRRHEALRTLFAPGEGGEPLQRISPGERLEIALVDLTALAAARRAAEAPRQIRRAARSPFNLEEGPLLRVLVVRTDEERHQLLLTMHHIVSDAWSLGILVREMGALYTARVGGTPPSLPPLPVQYADYAVWQRRFLSGAALEQRLAYWRGQFQGAQGLLELAGDRPRPAVRSGRGGTVSLAVPKDLTAKLERLGRTCRATPFMTLLTGLFTLLHRLSGQRDVLVGSPTANRERYELEGLIGFFANTLVLRGDLSGRPSFRQALEKVRQATLGAYAHQDLPFEKLVEELAPERDLSRTPLFQVAFALQNVPASTLELPGLVVRPLELDAGTAKFDLTLALTERRGDGLVGTLEYSADLFERTTATRWTTHLRNLLAAAAAAPEHRLEELALLSPAERHQLREWRRAPAPPATAGTLAILPELFAAQAAVRSNAIALSQVGVSRTYGELERRSNQLAHHLRSLGVGPEVRVALFLERSPELVWGVLGILKAGGAYVPVDPSYPAERLRAVLADAGVEVLVTSSQLATRVPEVTRRRVLLDGDAGEIAARSSTPPAAGTAPRNLAYVIYTSGSTGRPKGVGVTHRNAVRLLGSTRHGFGFGPGDVWTIFHSIAFDFSVWEIWGALAYGGRLVVVPYWVSRSPEDFRDLLVRERVTVLNQTPSAFRQLLAAVEKRDAGRLTLRRVIFGGEALDVASLAPWFRCHGDRQPLLVNMYGITETTVHVTYRPLAKGDADRGLSPIGRGIPDLALGVLDSSGRPVPAGAPGELHVGGPGVARGYLDRPGLTAERFVPDPFAEVPGSRLYRSGDRVSWLATGELAYLGRLDAQVKLRGHRIEPGEIEAALGDHPAVERAVVVPREDLPGGRVLVAHVVAPGQGALPEPEELREWLRRRLPEPMVPSFFVAEEKLPLTVHGKVDRKSLGRRNLPMLAKGAAPTGPVEELLAGLYSEVLGVEGVGRDDSFFELGGHSLLATRLVARIREDLGVELPVRLIFERPQLAQLARAVIAERRESAETPAPIAPLAKDGELPLSFAQERLWFLHQMGTEESAAYHVPVGVELRGELWPAILAAALAALVERHEALRTRFEIRGGRPVQSIDARAALPLPVVDVEAPGRRAEERLRRGFIRRPFDLERAPLARALLLRRGAHRHTLLLNLHHIITDGWSMDLVVRELAEVYNALADGRPARLPELPLRYGDYAAWQRQALSGERLEREIRHWRERLAGAPATLELPCDRSRPAVRSYRGAALPMRLTPELERGLRSFARQRSATLFMVLLAAFDALLARFSGQPGVVVGTPVANRTRREIEGIVGFFVNTLALYVELSGDPTFAELVARVREVALAAYTHQELPFEKLVEELRPERSLSHSPFFQVMLSLENMSRLNPELPRWRDASRAALRLEPLPLPGVTAKFDLSLNLSETDDGLAGGIEYASDLFEATTAARLVRHLETVLEAAAAEPSRHLAEIALFSAVERHQLVQEWSLGFEAPVFPPLPLHLVEDRSERAGDAVALVERQRRVSYRQLDEQAERMARRLRRLGVGPEVRVAVASSRPARVVAAILATWKAGGVHLPVDPHQGAERLAFILRDAEVRVLFADAALVREPPEPPARLVTFEEVEAAPRRAHRERLDLEILPDQLAYVIYTSGTTGVPKGVAQTHAQVAPFFHWGLRRFSLGSHTRALHTLSYYFDFGFFDLVFVLIAGGTLHLPDLGERTDLASCRRLVVRHGVDFLEATPSYVRELCATARELTSLTRVHLGGEILPRDLVRRIEAVTGDGCEVFNGYGPTETGIGCAMFRLHGRPLDRGLRTASVPIGRRSGYSLLYVLDRHLRPTPIGVAGELRIGGPGVARGYLGRPSLTAERFVPDPFDGFLGGRPGRRMYASGDRVRHLGDGTLEFLGRFDHQVKLRGYRIELGEVEAALDRHPAVRESVVLARDDPSGNRTLVAYLVARQPEIPPRTVAALPLFLKEHLPGYMVPASYRVLEAFPLSPNGKIDRAALPAPEDPGTLDGAAPSTPAEEILAGIWADLLERERVGRDDDFFALGGHSLLATRAAARASAAFGVELGPRLFFEHPTVKAMAEEIEGRRTARQDARHEPIEPLPRGSLPADVGPLSFAQERMWLLHQLTPGGGAYHSVGALLFQGRLDVGVLRRVMTEIARRHEVLRTAFPEAADGRPIQRIAPPGEHPLPLADLTRLAADARRREVERRLRSEGRRPFDMARGPLFRTALLRRGDAEHVLLVAHHHVVFDGGSLGILLREVGALYRAFLAGRTASLAPLPVQYADYAAWQRRWLAGEVFESEIAHWRRLLEPVARATRLPADLPRPEGGGAPAGRVILDVDDATAAELQRLAQGRGATLFMVLLAAWNALLHRLTGSPAVVVGTPIANRNRAETEGLIGFFVNTLVLCTDLEGDPPFPEILDRVRALALEAYAHQDVPLERLVEATASPGSSPFQVMFAVQNFPVESLELPGVELAPAEAEAPPGARRALFDLTVTMAERDGVLRGSFEYDAAIFEQATMEALSGHFVRLLDEVARDPERRVAELLPLAAAEERQWRSKAAVATETAEETADPRRHEEEKEKRLKARVAEQRGQLSATKQALLRRRLRGAQGRGKRRADAGQGDGAAGPSVKRQAIPKRPPGETVPLSYSQERLWFLEQLEPGTTTYTLPLPLRLRGRIDPAQLAATFDELLRRHEVLRTRYESRDDQAVQVIEPPRATGLPLVDLTGLASSELAAGEARRQVAAQSTRPFDLQRGPVLRAALLRLEPDHHVLTCNAHHIALDGWSVGILVRDLTMIYEASRAGRPSPLPDLPVQYADYALWQRGWLSGEVLERQVRYWRQRLDGPRPLDLPADRPRPPVQTFRGEVATLELSGELSEKLRDLSRRAEATLFVTLLAAFKVLPARLCGATDVTVGTPIAGRGRAELEGMIGLFLNTLVLRTDLSGRPSFRQLLARVRDTALGAYSHQDVPFEKLLEVLQPERDLSRTPLFQVFFNMLNLPPTEVRRPDFQVEPLESTHVQSKFDLTVYVQDRPRGLSCYWVYNADLFDSGRIAAMLGQFEGILRQVTNDPGIPIDQISLLPAHASPFPLPDPAKPLSDAWHSAVHEVFAEWVRREPERTAVIDGGRAWTYGELAAAARLLARELRARGTGRGDVVAIWAARRAELVAALLAVLEAGAAFLILDPVHPLPRHRACLEQAAPRVFLELEAAAQVPDALQDFLTARGTAYLAVGTGPAATAQPRAPQPGGGARLHPADLAYMVFTSGSTGTPKGVLGRHGSLSHFIPWQRETFGLTAADRYSLLSGLAHDPLQRDVFTPLQLGAAVCVPPAEVFEVPGRLAVWLREAGVTIAHLTPAMVQLLAEGAERPLPLRGALRWAFVTGEALTALEAERLRGVAPGVRVVNSYGSTETQRSVGYYSVPPGAGTALPGTEVLPLGRGAEGVQLLVLGVGGALAGIGEVGEISMRSHHLALGYLDDPALTARRFVPHPLGGAPGERVYLTGDLGRYRADGLVTFAGRADRQVQVRGYRVEPREIEAALRRHPAVREAAVVEHHRKSSPGRETPLIAWVVPENVVPENVVPERVEPENEVPEAALTLDAQALRGHLSERLPSYMVPAAFVALERLPLTPNRKLDRAALARRRLPAASVVSHGTAPRTPVEEVMLEIWREVLGGGESVAQIGVDESFFELGGHSILATRLMARIGRAFGVTPPLRRLFEAPTVAALTAVVERERGRGNVLAELSPVVPDLRCRHEPFPLTDVQQAYWVGRSGAFELGNVATHSYQELELENLDTHRLELAWRRLVARHDMLRAVILPDGRQKILDTVPAFEIRHLDLRGRPPAEVEATLGALRRELSHQVLDTETWPLFDLRVTLLDGGRTRFHLSRDLLIYDAFSASILQRELGLFYLKPEAELEPLELSFRDYVLAEEALRQSELHRRSEAYWRRRLASLAAAPELPLATDPAALGRPRFERRRGRLDAEVWSAVKRQGNRFGLTPSAVLLTAWARVLAAYSEGSRFTLNLTLFNRLPLHPQVRHLVGDFTSLILLEVDTRPGDTLAELARRVQEQLWDDLDHRMVSGVWVQRELRRQSGGARRTGMPIVFTSTLGLDTERAAGQEAGPAGKDQASSDADAALGGGSIFAITQTPQVWLDHQVGENNGRLGFNWDSVAGLFPTGLLDAMFEAYRGLLASLATEEGWLEAHPVLVPAAQLVLYREVNDTARPVPEGLLHGPFLARAVECPDAIAVLDGACHLTYGELRRSSGRLAHALHERGARPGKLVAVVMDKGWEQIVAVLGILRAGAAYLPIDPELPSERVRHLLERCHAELALTQSHRHEELASLGDPQSGKPQWWVVDFAVGQDLSQGAQSADPAPANPEDLAYVIFTSGSTGTPKGVMIEHRSALNTVLDVNECFAVTARDKVLALSSLSFDLSVYDIFGLLAAGGTIVMPGRTARRDPAHWSDLVTKNGVTLWNTVPALMQMYTEHVLGQPTVPPSPLRRVMMSGDWIPVDLPERIRRLGESLEVVSLGGATEASIWSILYPIGEVGEAWPSIPYGRPMANQSFHVLDSGLLPRPFWVPGELYIGGVGLGRGYFEDEEQTATRFLTAPETTPLAGERLYRTGDLGRYLPDGNIEFLGREDFQVKIQGYRIELGEIEAALVQHPALREAVALAVGEAGPGGSRRLVACFVSAAAGVEPTTELAEDLGPALDAYLREKIPPYMVPSSFHAVEELPLTANGKVDRAELVLRVTAAAPGGARAEARVLPRNPREEKVAAIWAEILEVEQVGVHDNFFELGGDSIHGIRIVTRANEEGIPLSSTALFEHQTVAQLVAALDAAVAAPALVELRRGGTGMPLFCVHAAGGNVFNYRPLAEILSAQHPVYGLRARGFSPGEEPRRRVEEMAAAYLEEVRSTNPDGPYALLGWSFGGLVAYEMARRILAADSEVAFLGILDTAAASPDLGAEPSEREILLMALSGQVPKNGEGLRQLGQDELLELGARYLRQAWGLPAEFGVDALRRYLEVYRTNGRAWRAYEPPPYSGRLTLLRAGDRGGEMPVGEIPPGETPASPDDETLGWAAVVSGEVEVNTMPGSHGSVLRPPHVEALARYLRKVLS